MGARKRSAVPVISRLPVAQLSLIVPESGQNINKGRMGRSSSAVKLNPDGTFCLSENDIEEQVLDFMCRAQGWIPIRLHVGKVVPIDKAYEATKTRDYSLIENNIITLNPEGTSDWLFVHAFYPAVFIEVKRPGRKPTPKQMEYLRSLQQVKVLATWTDGLDDRHKCNMPLIPWYQENVLPASCKR